MSAGAKLRPHAFQVRAAGGPLQREISYHVYNSTFTFMTQKTNTNILFRMFTRRQLNQGIRIMNSLLGARTKMFRRHLNFRGRQFISPTHNNFTTRLLSRKQRMFQHSVRLLNMRTSITFTFIMLLRRQRRFVRRRFTTTLFSLTKLLTLISLNSSMRHHNRGHPSSFITMALLITTRRNFSRLRRLTCLIRILQHSLRCKDLTRTRMSQRQHQRISLSLVSRQFKRHRGVDHNIQQAFRHTSSTI